MMNDGYLLPILQRPPRVDCAEWAKHNRFMPSTHSMFSFIQTPFFEAPTKYLSDLATTSRVVLCTPAQVGKTTAIENFIGWIAAYDRANTLLIFDRLKTGQKMSKNRLRPFLRDVCGINATGQAGTKYNNPDASKEVCNISLCTGANLMIGSSASASDLCSTPAKFLCCDELDRWKGELKGEGDPVSLALQRQMRFRGMTLFTSTPTTEQGRIHQHFLLGTQETWGVICDTCGEWFDVRYDDIIWNDVPVVYCSHCGAVYDEKGVKKLKHEYSSPMNLNPEKDEYGRIVRSFRVFGTLCDAFYSWGGLKELERSALSLGEANFQSFRNTRLGELYIPRSERIIYAGDVMRVSMADYTPQNLPCDVKFIVAGVDTQDSGFAVEICGFSEDRRRIYGIDWIWIQGAPKSDQSAWQKLHEALSKTYMTDDGRELRVMVTCHDSGGHCTQEVYAFSLRRKNHYAIKGVYDDKEIISRANHVTLKTVGTGTGRVLLTSVGTIRAKDVVDEALTDNLEGRTRYFWPLNGAYDDDYFSQLTAEKRVVEPNGKIKWVQLPGRHNEGLDCRVYAIAAAEILVQRVCAMSSIKKAEPQKVEESTKDVTKSTKDVTKSTKKCTKRLL